MTATWMIQISPRREMCARCHMFIRPWVELYFRSVVSLDTNDEYGYDVCAKCRRKLPNPPPPPIFDNQ